MKRIDHNVRYIGFYASVAAVLWLAHEGMIPLNHPFRPGGYLLETDPTSVREQKILRTFFGRRDVVYALIWQFALGGGSLVLAADFNTADNEIDCIGAGTGGTAGTPGGSVPGCTGATGGDGGTGGAGGAFAQILNYNLHTAGQTVNLQVGAGDTWFDSNTTVLAKAAFGSTGGLAASSIGSLKRSGGNGVVGTSGSPGSPPGNGGGGGDGGGGGGAAGPAGDGLAGGGTIGGAGDGGNTPHQADGTQFQTSPPRGSGGGGSGALGGAGEGAVTCGGSGSGC